MKRAALIGFGLLAFAASVVLANACAHVAKVGDACKPADAYCSNYDAVLSCEGGHLVPFACHGPKGCMLGAERAVLCDQSKAAVAGELCLSEYNGTAQCDAKEPGSYLQCLGGSWNRNACPMGRACKDSGGQVSCQ